jgi:hypothetical protein
MPRNNLGAALVYCGDMLNALESQADQLRQARGMVIGFKSLACERDGLKGCGRCCTCVRADAWLKANPTTETPDE